jgi:hypothetical protein
LGDVVHFGKCLHALTKKIAVESARVSPTARLRGDICWSAPMVRTLSHGHCFCRTPRSWISVRESMAKRPFLRI